MEKEKLSDENIISLKGMYEDYFLDYASYVILERAVPGVDDGLKPVQRRILHSMREMDDGRYHKVANIIGQTMQYHPHGDAAIGDALVKLGQKNLLIDCQGNWGDIRTGDSAAASRYIEARLTKFALEVLFNAKTTEWQLSYDGRKKEPIHLPAKFPLVLAQGVEGIAVGLSTKILPHNFIELIKASIKILQGKRVKIYPDFETGGLIDVAQYGGGKRGGKVRVRARIETLNKKTLIVKDLPYGVTTTQLIDSIIKANDKGKIKVKKVVDNTAKEVEIAIELHTGTSPDLTIGALYAFTDCEISISPNACIIIDNKPHFLTVEEILKIETENTKKLLRLELEIQQHELEEKWHFLSLEKIFIENRIYHDIEECETWEEVLTTIDEGLKKYVVTPSMKAVAGDKRIRLVRDIIHDDIIRLTEIKIKRISKYNSFKADETMAQIEHDLDETKHHLQHLTEYAIAYFERLLEKYGKGRERKTEITTFGSIDAVQVIANNAKLYVNRSEGFVGYGMKGDELIGECSDIDDVIAIMKDGSMKVVRIGDKVFVGKNILHAAVWKKGDDRTTYNLIYTDGGTGKSFAKRFHVKAITRDRLYDLTAGNKRSKIHYLTSNPNGEAEIVTIQLSQGCKAKKKIFEYDFGDLDIKGRSSKGNTVTKYPVRKITLKERGKSTLGAQHIWMDTASGNLNKDERGTYLGAFDTGDSILIIYQNGAYELNPLEITNRYVPKDIAYIGKFDIDQPISAIYYDGEKGATMVKRFNIETSSLNQKFSFITDHRSSKLYFVGVGKCDPVEYSYKAKNKSHKQMVQLDDFIEVKGWKSIGNKLHSGKLLSAKPVVSSKENSDQPEPDEDPEPAKGLSAGDTIEFEINPQNSIFDLDED